MTRRSWSLPLWYRSGSPAAAAATMLPVTGALALSLSLSLSLSETPWDSPSWGLLWELGAAGGTPGARRHRKKDKSSRRQEAQNASVLHWAPRHACRPGMPSATSYYIPGYLLLPRLRTSERPSLPLVPRCFSLSRLALCHVPFPLSALRFRFPLRRPAASSPQPM